MNRYPITHRMITEVVKVGPRATIGDVIKTLKSRHYELTDYIYVLGEEDKLLGVISIDEVFNHRASVRVDRIMRRDPVTVSPGTDPERVAHLALKHGIKAVPVVEGGMLLGAVGAKDILHILNTSLKDDILHFAGIHRSHLQYENTLGVPLRLSILHRIPWLLIGLVGIMFAAGFISIFESVLEKYLILAFFIPAIVYMSDALGTQHQTLFVRDIAVLGKELKIGRYIAKQMSIAMLLSLMISALVFLIISFLWTEFFVGLVITLSMFIALIVSSFTSLLMILFLIEVGQDPALGSGPFATVISDVTSIIIYFVVAVALL